MATNYIVSTGLQNNLVLADGDTLDVYGSGTVTQTYVSSGGVARISREEKTSRGGKAVITYISQFGNVHLLNGGQASTTVISSGGMFHVSGGYASNTAIADNGSMVIVGGSADRIAVQDSKSRLDISGGILNSISVGDADADSKLQAMVNVSGGNITSAVIYAGGTMTMYEGVAHSTWVSSGGTMAMSGGRASSVEVSGGLLKVANASANAVSAVAEGNVQVLNLGKLSNGYAGPDGTILVGFGGSASAVTVEYGTLTVRGGYAEDVHGDTFGTVNVSSGGTVTGIICSSPSGDHNSAVLNVWRDGVVSSGLIAEEANVYFLGQVSGLNMISGGILTLYGGRATGTNVMESAHLNVSGGVAQDTVLCPVIDGLIDSSNYGTPAYMEVISNGSASNTVVSRGGSLTVVSGGTATDTTVLTGGKAEVIEAAASGLEISSGGTVRVSSGGTAANTLIHAGGSIYALGNGFLSSAVVESGGVCQISSGGIAGYLTVETGGQAVLSSGTILNGPVTANGGTLTFVLALLDPSESPLVYNLNWVTGTPDYQAVVVDSQSAGSYVLGSGVSEFSDTVTVSALFYGEVGAITLGQSLKYDNQYYGLSLDGRNLVMTVSDPGDTRLTLAGEFATPNLGDELALSMHGSIRLQSLSDPAGETVGTLYWDILGSLDFDADGLLELAVKDIYTGNVFLADDPAGGISEEKLLNGTCLGLLGDGYSYYGAGSFDGKSGQNDVLMKGPAFGDPTLSLNYGLPVWAFDNGVKQYDGWLGALVNTWQAGAPLRGDTSNPADVNANNYQYDLVGIGDFNGDGRSDVMLQNTMPSSVYGKAITGAGDIFVFLTGDENAIRSGAAPTVCYTGKVDPVDLGGWCVAGIGDFNNDNIDDVLLLNQANGQTACWIMNNGQMQSASGLGTLAVDQKIAGIWDVDGDGTDDVVLADATRHSAWLINNGQCINTQYLA